MLYSRFDRDGIILSRYLEKAAGTYPSMMSANSFMLPDAEGVVEAVNVDYVPVKINRKCPSCGAPSLERRVSIAGGSKEIVPAVPRYKCASCGQECYHISDEYLADLVSDGKELFSDAEKEQLKKNPEEFMNELKEYISRIFAMKNIKRII